jgi:hypothetical protein
LILLKRIKDVAAAEVLRNRGLAQVAVDAPVIKTAL